MTSSLRDSLICYYLLRALQLVVPVNDNLATAWFYSCWSIYVYTVQGYFNNHFLHRPGIAVIQ